MRNCFAYVDPRRPCVVIFYHLLDSVLLCDMLYFQTCLANSCLFKRLDFAMFVVITFEKIASCK